MLAHRFLLFFLLGASRSHPSARHATVINRDAKPESSYDFVMIGGGASGLTVANRLTEIAETSILVVEYGPFDQQEPSVLVPGLPNLTSTPHWYNLTSIPQPGHHGRQLQVPAAAVLVEEQSSIVCFSIDAPQRTVMLGPSLGAQAGAGMIFYHTLRSVGFEEHRVSIHYAAIYSLKFDTGQSENSTPAAADDAEDFDISWNTSVHGFGGPIHSTYPGYQFPSIKNFFQGWHSLGITTQEDPGAGNKSGVFWAPSSLDPKAETRSYARPAHYDRVIASRPDYHLLTNTAVQKILVYNGTATGVQFIDRSFMQMQEVGAKKEVILATGAPHSPQILQVSGFGPKGALEKLGVEVQVDLLGVGQNFHDHPAIFAVFDFQNIPQPTADTLTTNETYAAEQLALYWSDRQGAYTIVNQGGNTVAFLPLPSITSSYQSIIDFAMAQFPSSIYPNNTDPSVLAGYAAQRSIILRLYASTSISVQETGFNSASVMPITNVKPLSRGSITVTSTSIFDSPAVDFGTFTDPTDIEVLVAAIKMNRALIATSAMQELGPVELSPGANVTTDEQLREALREALRELAGPTYSHPCCSCPMMPKELGGVVGPDLKVYGVRGLSVVDASVMPMIQGRHTSATVYAVAEKAADEIKSRHGLKSCQTNSGVHRL